MWDVKEPFRRGTMIFGQGGAGSFPLTANMFFAMQGIHKRCFLIAMFSAPSVRKELGARGRGDQPAEMLLDGSAPRACEGITWSIEQILCSQVLFGK